MKTVRRRFDWTPHPDTRNRQYPVRTLLKARELRAKNWRVLPRLDQGSEGACVGFGWSHTLGGYPKPQPVTNDTARELYHLAQTLDEWSGEDYSGTSVLAGAKAAAQLGRIDAYYWCETLEDVLATVAWYGPVTLGVPWYEGMLDPDANDHIYVTGESVGGHCVSIHGVHLSDRIVRIRNSWGRPWGRGGDCFLSWDDLALLLSREGEACVAVKSAAATATTGQA